MTTILPALALLIVVLIILRAMPNVRSGPALRRGAPWVEDLGHAHGGELIFHGSGEGNPWDLDKAIDARPHLRIADEKPIGDDDTREWDARFKAWQEATIEADDPEISTLLEKGRYEEA